MDAQPSYSWRNKQATVIRARISGENFLPLPGGYRPESTSRPRGGQVPRITDVSQPGSVIEISNREGGSFADPAPTPESFFKGAAAPLRRTGRERLETQRAQEKFGFGI